MSGKNVLLIDDSATIRRLVDNELSAAGFHVILASTAEEGLVKALSEKPDLIILDHQLPGTTGYEVCCQLLANTETAGLPVVASSTLRKKAYSEYIDCDNVVDMLPKPYTPEVLVATVENAIDTAAMIVQSQTDGSAVPEVINELGESDLAGTFECFGLREVIDLINNGSKHGVLEILTDKFRVYVFTEGGRIQAVSGSGIDISTVTSQLPESMSELAPVAKFTVTGKKGSEIDGLVELLNNKVLDPRLLKKLLRLQAAILLRMCFHAKVKSFRFDKNQTAPDLFRKLSLDSSLVALLVEGSIQCSENELPEFRDDQGFVRKAIRGQSVDRAGLSSKHMQLMKSAVEPATIKQISEKLQWDADETRRVLAGFVMAELIESVAYKPQLVVYCVSTDPEFKKRIQESVRGSGDATALKSVSDCLALGLLIRRRRPQAIVMDISDASVLRKFENLKAQDAEQFSGIRLIAAKVDCEEINDSTLAAAGFDFAVSKNADKQTLRETVLSNSASPTPQIMTTSDAKVPQTAVS